MKRILQIPAAIIKGIVTIFKTIFNSIVIALKAIFKTIVSIFTAIYKGIIAVITAIIRGIQQFFAFLKRQILAFIAALKNPFGTSVGSTKGLIYALITGVIVALLTIGLQPFGLSEFNHDSKTLYLAGFGVMAFLGVIIGMFLLPMLLQNFYDEHHWTVGKQIIQITLISLIISVLCVIYSNIFNIVKLDFITIFIIALAIGLLGGTMLTFIQESMQKGKYITNANNISRNLGSLKIPTSKQALPVLLFGESSNKLSLLPNQLIYAETSAASTDFYYQNLTGIEKKTVNDSLANVEKEFASHPQFVRCGKSQIVNIKALKNVTGSARGYQIELSRVDKKMSVSRKNLGNFEKAVS
jgi:LytTr DNA-binding domain